MWTCMGQPQQRPDRPPESLPSLQHRYMEEEDPQDGQGAGASALWEEAASVTAFPYLRGGYWEVRVRLFTAWCDWRTRNNRQKLKYERFRPEIRRNSSAMRPVKQWKRLHREALHSPCLEAFTTQQMKPWATWSDVTAEPALGSRLV